MLYVAYGSNIPTYQMKQRCNSAKFIGRGKIENYKLNFCYHADIEPCNGESVEVVVWDISKSDEQVLDTYEGYPTYYIKHNILVTMEDGTTKKAMVYEMAIDRKIEMYPTISYYNVIKDGYEEFGLNINCLNKAVEEVGGVVNIKEPKYIYK